MADTKKKSIQNKTAGRSKKNVNQKGRKNQNNNSSGRKSRSQTKTGSGKGTGKITRSSSRRAKTYADSQSDGINMNMEGQLILSFFVMVLLLLSNFGICGTAGDFLSSFFFGLFGWVQYVMPVAFFVAIAVLLVNDYSILALKKCFAGFLVLTMISSYVQLICKGGEVGIYELFSMAIKDHMTGGVIGGGFACTLYKGFGTAGSLVIITCILLLSLIMLVQKSVLDFFKNWMHICKTHFLSWQEKRKQRILVERENKKRRKTLDDKEREKKCEEKVKEIEENKKRMEEKKRAEKNTISSSKIAKFHSTDSDTVKEKPRQFFVPTFESSEEVKRKDSVKELHPEIYPFTQEDGKTNPFEQELDFSTFSFRKNMEQQSVEDAGMEDNEVIQVEALEEEMIPDEIIPEEALFERTLEKSAVEKNSVKKETVSNMLPKRPVQDIIIHKEDTKMEEEKESSTLKESQRGERQPLPEAFSLKKAEGKDYVFPPITLLNKGSGKKGVNYDEQLKHTAQKLQETLHSFGVNVTITDISFGPTVTRYEMVPEQGTKVSKIVSLTDDIKLNLAAEDIRIEAPIPGKSAIGIEVPNKDVLMVHLRELIDTPKFRNFKSRLAFAVGKDIGGQTVISDIAGMPHLLIAGATGSGKSVCINTLIMSILYKARPDEVKLIMIDPKMVELSIYNGIPHLLIPVVTDPKKASGALNWAVAEMTDRYEMFGKYGVRNLQGYNNKVHQLISMGEVEEEKLKPFPQIVVIVDELADLMMVAPGEVEDAIVRLTQLARAAGIHLVIATQRPSVNVITGLIKANVPSRIAFSVSSGVDSRTIIDMNGAEKLLGKGDMLFFPAGASKPSRVQGAFVTDEEIAAVVDFLKKNETTAVFDEEVSEKIEQRIGSLDTMQERDEYFLDAARFILEKDKASIGMLQRMFKIGFNRAARIMDQLAEAGIVGPEEGTKPRKILMSPEQLEQYIEEFL